MALPNYPKAKYRAALEGEGDIVRQYSLDRHPYVSRIVESPAEEESIGSGWFDHPSLIGTVDQPESEPEPEPKIEEPKPEPKVRWSSKRPASPEKE